MFLTDEELIALTKRRRARWQARQLDHMKIPYRERTDGTLAVLRIHAETIEGATAALHSRPEPVLQP